jgi:Ni/Co efflux regulator RcnB
MDHVRLPTLALCALFCLDAFVSSAHAAPPEGHGKHGQASEQGAELIHADVNVDEVRQIAVAQHYTGYRALPPGIRKNLARGKPLPPGIAKKVVKEPMLERLPTYHGYEWQRCGTDLVLIEVATQIVADVLANIFQ